MSLKEPIVEGAYYLTESGCVLGPMRRNRGTLRYYQGNTEGLTRRVWITHTDPAEVVTELRERVEIANRLNVRTKEDYHRGEESAFEEAADLVAEKLGVES